MLLSVGSCFIPSLARLQMRLSCQSPGLLLPWGSAWVTRQRPYWKSSTSTSPKVVVTYTDPPPTPVDMRMAAPEPCVACRKCTTALVGYGAAVHQRPSDMAPTCLGFAGRNYPCHRHRGYGGVSSAVAAMASDTELPSM